MPDNSTDGQKTDHRSKIWSGRELRLRLGRLAPTLLPLLLCLGVGRLAVYPLGSGNRIPLDAFTGPHLLVMQQLGRALGGAPLGAMYAMNYPEGVGVQVVGFGTLLPGLALQELTGPVDALFLALALNLGFGGWFLYLALRKLGLAGALVGGLAWASHPLFLSWIANGQYENVIGPGFALALLGLAWGSWAGIAMVATGALLTAFSSPYHCFPLALVIGFGLPLLRPRLWPLVGLAAALGVAPGIHYYASPPGGLTRMGPGPSREQIAVDLPSLLQPTLLDAYGRGQGGPEIRGEWAGTLKWTLGRVGKSPRLPTRIQRENTHATYMGRGLVGLALLGVFAGLIRGPRRLVFWGLGVGAGALLLALGPGELQLLGQKIYLPWSYASQHPSLQLMGMSYRFVSGLAFALCVLASIGPSLLPPGIFRWLVVALASVGVVGEGLALGPFKMPLDSRTLELDPGYAALPETGAVVDLPTDLSPEAATWSPMMAVFHGHPTSWKPGEGGPQRLRQSALDRTLRGQIDPDAGSLHSNLATLRRDGYIYLAIHSDGVAPERLATVRSLLEAELGPPDASGKVLGWRLSEEGGEAGTR
jgi:hypothetical protein